MIDSNHVAHCLCERPASAFSRNAVDADASSRIRCAPTRHDHPASVVAATSDGPRRSNRPRPRRSEAATGEARSSVRRQRMTRSRRILIESIKRRERDPFQQSRAWLLQKTGARFFAPCSRIECFDEWNRLRRLSRLPRPSATPGHPDGVEVLHIPMLSTALRTFDRILNIMTG